MPEYIAYQGKEFTIEWFFNKDEKSQSLKYFEGLSENQQDKFFHLLKVMSDFGNIKNKEKFRNEGNGIYTFKIKPDRFLCFFFKDKKIIMTNAFTKKQQKLPKKEKDRALENKKNYIYRVEKGEYYYD